MCIIMSYNDPLFLEAIELMKETFDKLKDLENVEVEFRIGKLYKGFVSEITKEQFNIIQEKLSDSDVWDSISTVVSEDYFKDDKRLTIMNGETICIKKEKIKTFDFNFIGSCFDIRVNFAKETPCRKFVPKQDSFCRSKNRTSYIVDGLSFDLTTVTTKDSGTTYSFELEIKDFKRASSHYIIHDCFLKIKDIIEFCSPLDPSHELVPKY